MGDIEEVFSAVECLNCGGTKSISLHCHHDDCFWFICKYCWAISDGEFFFIDSPRKHSR